MHRAVWISSWAFGAVVVAGLALWAVAGDRVLLGRYTGYVMPWLALVLAPAALAALVAGRRALAFFLALPLAAIVAVHAPRFAPRRAHAGEGALRVMSWNTWSRNEDPRRIAGVVRAFGPDLLLVQEIRPAVFAGLMRELGDLYRGEAVHHAYDSALMQGVVSRYPVEPLASLRHKGQAQEAVVRAPGGPISVFNVHPLRRHGWRYRYDQIGLLLEDEIAPQPGPAIVAGDFNAPEHSQLVALLSRRLTNAHDAAGSGLGFTFPTPAVRLLGVVPAFPLVRIDHVFFSRHFAAVRAGTLEDHGGSDHRPVFAELVVR
jgi:vancomycin resistance protein VanJ